VLFASLSLSCGAARPGAPPASPDVVGQTNPCEALLLKKQKVMIAVLEALPQVYTWMAAVILRVEERETNRYDVWIQRNEATDIVTFQTGVSPECEVTVVRVSERVADRPAFEDPCSRPAQLQETP
jgi:hypothetical protein